MSKLALRVATVRRLVDFYVLCRHRHDTSSNTTSDFPTRPSEARRRTKCTSAQAITFHANSRNVGERRVPHGWKQTEPSHVGLANLPTSRADAAANEREDRDENSGEAITTKPKAWTSLCLDGKG